MKDDTSLLIGSDNVFADLGLPDADELQFKSLLAIQIRLGRRVEIRISSQETDPDNARTLLVA